MGFSQSQDTLTNEKIIKLSKLGLPAATIVTKIKTSYPAFDISTDALIYLNENSVSAEVINSMISESTAMAAKKAEIVDPKDPLSRRKPGIYYNYNLDSEKPIKKLDPSVISTTKSGGFGSALAAAYTGGISSSNLVASLAGKTSQLQFMDGKPVFYFNFASDKNYHNDEYWYFTNASSPKEFVLVKLKQKKDQREVTIGSENSYGGSSGIPNAVKVKFDYKELTEGIFEVSFSENLKSGEYAFVYAGSTPYRGSESKLFDFGINMPKKK